MTPKKPSGFAALSGPTLSPLASTLGGDSPFLELADVYEQISQEQLRELPCITETLQ